jgi:Zn-dependent protease
MDPDERARRERLREVAAAASRRNRHLGRLTFHARYVVASLREIARERSANPFAELLIAAAGPASNHFLYAFFFSFPGKLSGWLSVCNLVLFVFNLLPFGSTDGQRMLYNLRLMVGAGMKRLSA